jgi:hypothetical protein
MELSLKFVTKLGFEFRGCPLEAACKFRMGEETKTALWKVAWHQITGSRDEFIAKFRSKKLCLTRQQYLKNTTKISP